MNNQCNNLVVIENGQLTTYILDDKLTWQLGRISKDNDPDIKMYSTTVSRKHGRFQNADGFWCYIDNNGKNGTFYNGKKVTTGIRGRIKPIMINDGDCFIFGGGEEAVLNTKTVWARYSTKRYSEKWRIEDIQNMETLTLISRNEKRNYKNPKSGTVIEMEMGMAIFMGSIVYLNGEIDIKN